MKNYYWKDDAGELHGPVGIRRLIELRSERTIDSTTLVREGDGQWKPFHAHDLKAEIERSGSGEVRLMLGVLAGSLVAFASVFVATFAERPLSVAGLGLFVIGASSLAFVAGRHRQVGLSVTAVVIPAAVGMMATIQQPELLRPFESVVCESGEVLVSASAPAWDSARWNDPLAAEVTEFWTACATQGTARRTYSPMFAHGVVLFVLFGAVNRVGRLAVPVGLGRTTG